MSKNQFPDFFITKGPIPITVTPLKFGSNLYYQASLTSDGQETELEPQTHHLKPYLDNDEEMLDCGDIEDNYDIVFNKNGKFCTSFYVPSQFLSFIIGAKGSKLKALQRDTNTIIKVPRMNETGDVKITGDTERKVASARSQIAMIVAQRKQRLPPTHFIAIPIVSEAVQRNLLKLQESVMASPPRGVTNSLFQKPVKLHLTLVMLHLLDDEEISLAKKLLQSCYDETISTIFPPANQKQKVTVRGLEIMNDDPSNVYVLYAKIHMANQELQDRLNKMCDTILNYFYKAGLAKKEYDRVKLHMTVLNASFRDGAEKRDPFNAQPILDEFGDFYFGEFELNELQLCIRGTTTSESGEPKYYDTALVLPL